MSHKRKPQHHCLDCGVEISQRARRCPEHAKEHTRLTDNARSQAIRDASVGREPGEPARCHKCGAPLTGRNSTRRVCGKCSPNARYKKIGDMRKAQAIAAGRDPTVAVCCYCGDPVPGHAAVNRSCDACKQRNKSETERTSFKPLAAPEEEKPKKCAPARPTGLPIYNPAWGRLSWDDYVTSRKEPAEVEA